MRMQKKAHKSINWFGIFAGIFLTVYVVAMLIPFLWGVMASLMDRFDFKLYPLKFPENPQFVNYLTVIREFKYTKEVSGVSVVAGMWEMTANTLFYSVGCALVNTFITCIVAYVCAKFDFWFCRMIEKIVLIVMIVPIVGALPAEIRMSKLLGLYDSILGMYVMRSTFLGMYFLVFVNMFRAIPDDFRDAASIDGAGNLAIFSHVMMPMVANTFGTILLLNFVVYWNDYQIPLVYLPSKPTLALGLIAFDSSNQAEICTKPIKLAACFLLFIPIFVLYIFTSERLMGNLQMGGLKG